MPPIRNISVKNINTIDVRPIHNWVAQPVIVNTIAPPVTLSIGKPVVQMPGCVESHPNSSKSNSIATDDPNGLKVYCDANAPSFTPLNYTPENLIYPGSAKFSGFKSNSKKRQEEEAEKPGAAFNQNAINTPPTGQPAVPLIKKPEKKEVLCESGFKLVDGKCVEEIPPKVELSFTEKYLPTLPQATTTATIAVVATSSALMAKPCADIILKLIKPTVKKIMKKIALLRRQPLKVESVYERRLSQRDRNHAIRSLRLALKR